MDLFNVLTLVGGLALFLFGMKIMGDALEKKAGGRILREQMERKYPGASIFDVVKLRLSQYADERESS